MRQITKELIQKYDIRMTKSLGQNFLVDDNIIEKIVKMADVDEKDIVIEVGPGIGNMTRRLAAKAGRLIAVEIDKHLIPPLEEVLKDYPNSLLINKDILKISLEEVIREEKEKAPGTERVKIVANLPYYITTPIIMKFLEENPGIDSMVFMIQKEVAERIVASPGGKDYGALSVAVQYYSKPERLFDVSPNCFVPKPEVDSTVIRMNIFKEPAVKLISRDMFFSTVKASFGQRRKTLLNALSNSSKFGRSKEEIRQILIGLGIDENARGETLTINQFAQISNEFAKDQ
ncbi:MAG TPA: 16S rRNA (adenine(1518)-N(6)/adenine(1519)-N(6))-dimethyltransferase RsmA [Pseudobacteroides sp.]|nr:16S rRNA (adenine(1518)-N(6)/adenine(1519)-N(6))-dimethyltransferase RsmA [Pseudobacteroides sp.]